MKILHVIASANLADGGPIEHAVRVGEALARRGHRQDFATIDPPGFAPNAEIPARVFALGSPNPPRKGLIARLRRKLNYAPRAIPWLRNNASAYDVVIVSGLWNFAIIAATRALAGGPTPYVVFTHGMLDPWFTQKYPLKSAIKQLLWFVNEGVLLRHADRVLFTCEEERRLGRTSFWPYRARERVVAFGTADAPMNIEAQRAAYHAAVPALGGRPFLLFLSRIHEKKGIDQLIEAFQAIGANHPDLDLVIAGPDSAGLQATLERRVASLGLAQKVHWPGMLKGDAKWGAFRGCEAFVLPSHQENFGIVVAEAMSCERPVLISNKVNIWREIEKDGAGLVGADDQAGVTTLLRRFLDMELPARKIMGERARASFLSRFHIDRAAEDLEKVLLDAASRSSPKTENIRSPADGDN
jgi:glycosyltransferase involved in cell wall biosynthesis